MSERGALFLGVLLGIFLCATFGHLVIRDTDRNQGKEDLCSYTCTVSNYTEHEVTNNLCECRTPRIPDSQNPWIPIGVKP